jgi:CspA family cold shock protein
MPNGTVKFYNNAKGFGFIRDEESQSEIFVHATGLMDNIDQDDQVSYDLIEGKKGMNAINVKKV